MAKKPKVKVYLEKNRDGDFDRIDTYKDKDKEDTTLGFWVKTPDKVMHKVGEFIFTEEMELPDDPEPPKPEEPKAPVIKPEDELMEVGMHTDVTMKIAVTDVNGKDTIKDIVWQQTMGNTVELMVAEDKLSAMFHAHLEGDYLFTITATDDTGLEGVKGINVKVREIVEPPPEPIGEFTPVLAAFGDSNSSSTAQTTFGNINKLENIKVLALGDFEYDSDFNDFKSKYGPLKDKTVISVRGNHDDTESESSSIESANNSYWGWKDPAVSKAEVDNIGIIGIDTQDGNADDKNGAQYKAVETALKEFADKDWRIVCFHKPMRCPKTKHSELTDVRAVYEPLFKQHGVVLAMSGHNHNQWLSSMSDGLRHVGTGNAGRDLYQIDSNPSYIEWSQDNDFGYIVVEQKQDKSQLKVKFMSNAGKTLRETLINKASPGPGPEPEPECPPGQHWDADMQHCVPDEPGPEPEPTDALWDSNVHGKWNDGNKRTITKKQGGQTTDDKSIFVAASGSPKLVIDGDGVAHLVAGSGGVENLSLKLLCSHQGNGSPLGTDGPSEGSKRGGGEGFSIAHTEWDCKREKFHNEHTSLGSENLPKKVEDNKWHSAKFSLKHDGTKIVLKGAVDYKDGKGFVQVMSEVDNSAEAWFFTKEGNKYFWIRLNNADHGRIYIMAYNYDSELTLDFMFEPSKNSIALKNVKLVAI